MAHSILIVDDQRDVIRMLESALASLEMPFVITGVLSGEEGLLEARLSHVDLLIADVRLPGMSGLDLYRQIRALRPAIRTILITGVPDEETRSLAAGAGADAFFTKPVPVDAFLTAVKRIFKASEPEQEPAMPAPTAVPDDDGERVSDRLTSLRLDTGADSIALVDDSGNILVRAGAPPDESFESAIVPSLMAAFSAGQKIAHSLGSSGAENISFYHGSSCNLVMAPVGSACALVITTSQPVSGERVASIHEHIKDSLPDVTLILSRMGVPVSSEEPPSVPPFLTEVEDLQESTPDALDEGLESLLEKNVADSLSEEAERFWELEEEQPGAASLSPGALSYEQAVQLGLAPEDE